MRFRFCALALGLAGLMAAPAALACSRVLWVGGPDQVFVGRTQDWTEKANTAFRVYPRGIARTGGRAGESPAMDKQVRKPGALGLRHGHP